MFSTAYFLPSMPAEDPVPYVFNHPYKRKPRRQVAETSLSKKIKTIEVIDLDDDKEEVS